MAGKTTNNGWQKLGESNVLEPVKFNDALDAIDTALGAVVSGAQALTAINAADASLDITGLAAAQGGSVTTTGGTSSTSTNAGGAVALVGGVGTTTAVGGEAAITGGAGAGASAGGAAKVTGGLGGATAGVGGAATIAAGAGQSTAAGGVASITGGASGAGATGNGGVAKIVGGAAASTDGTGGAAQVTGGAGRGAADGGAATITGGASGTGATGNGGAVNLTATAATSTNGNGGNVIATGGALAGTGMTGSVIARGKMFVRPQGAPTAKTVTAAITAAELATGIITTTGVTAPSVHQLPTGTLLLAQFPGLAAGDAFDFHVINTGTGGSDDATITVNTDVTIVGNPTVGAITDGTIISGSGHFRARYTGGVTWIVYRLA